MFRVPTTGRDYMNGCGHPGRQTATRAPASRRGTQRLPTRLRHAFVVSSLSRRFLSRLGAALVWFAAWALILQTTLLLCATSAATGVLDTTPAAAICHTSSTDSSNIPDPVSKHCSQCPLCAFVRGVTIPQALVTALPLPMVVTIVIERNDFFSPNLHVHGLPVARGPPATA